MTFTPLDDLFAHSTDAFEARYFAKDWLSILTEAGYSVHAYLEKEMQLHSAQNMLTCPRFSTAGIRPGSTYASRRLIFELGETPNVEWDWWIDPSSSASLVCHEFRYMVSHSPDWCFATFGLGCTEWRGTWPFRYPLWADEVMPNRRVIFTGWLYNKAQQEAPDKAAIRHARQARKKYPKYFEEVDRDSLIPGAWIDNAP